MLSSICRPMKITVDWLGANLPPGTSESVIFCDVSPMTVVCLFVFQEVINCIGGIQVLFPLLDQVKNITNTAETKEPTPSSDAATPGSPATAEWVMVPSYSEQGAGLFPIHHKLQIIFKMIVTSLFIFRRKHQSESSCLLCHFAAYNGTKFRVQSRVAGA